YNLVKELSEKSDKYKLSLSHYRYEKNDKGINFKPFGVRKIKYKNGYQIVEDFGSKLIVMGGIEDAMFILNLNYYFNHKLFEDDNWIDLILTHYKEDEKGGGDELALKDQIHFLFLPK
ncbi:MAG: hypothetical protein ACOCT9_01535, partial [archaeon]